MNKAKLEVLRLNNNDVITTSVCYDNTANHLYKDANTNDCIRYYYCPQHSRWESHLSNIGIYNYDPTNSQSGWFYFDGSTFKECCGDHSIFENATPYSTGDHAA